MIYPVTNPSDSQISGSGARFPVGVKQDGLEPASFREVEQCFRQAVQAPLKKAEEIGEADIVVGILLSGEIDTIRWVLETVTKGLEQFYPAQKCVIVATGFQTNRQILEVINAIPENKKLSRIAFLLDDSRLCGTGWNVRAIVEIARILGADLAILEAGLRSRARNGDIEGLAPDWVALLLEPIRREKMDLVISRFNRHYFEVPISTHLVLPLLTAIYNRPVHDLLGGQWGISQRLLRTYPENPRYLWTSEVGECGIDSWLATTAISGSCRVCEANLGIKLHNPSAAETELTVRQIARVIFDQIATDSPGWRKSEAIAEMPLVQPLATFGPRKNHQPDEAHLHPEWLLTNYRRGFNKFSPLYGEILPEETYQQLKTLAEADLKEFSFPAGLWVKIVYLFLLAYAFRKEFARADLRNSFIPLYEGYIASSALGIAEFKTRLAPLGHDEAEHLVSLEARRQLEALTDEFLGQKPDFLTTWEAGEEAILPPVLGVTYREFIPGVPLVVPLELTAPDGNVVTAMGIYESVFTKSRQEFEEFVYGRLQIPRNASSPVIGERVREFMSEVERQLDATLLPGDIHSLEGTQEVVEAIFRHFPHQETFTLSPAKATWLLRRYPPPDLLARLGHSSLERLLEEREPNDVLALASWSEEPEYWQKVWALIAESVRPEHFMSCSLKPLVVNYEDFPSLIGTKESSALDKITGRVVVSSLPRNMGGEFPKLRYLTTIAKNIVEAERFGKVWQRFAEEKKNFADKVINSIEGHWGRAPLSAHNIFENGHQRILVDRLREIAHQISQEAGEDDGRLRLVELLKDVADCYHLAFALPDGGFIPGSAWTWASYSFKGGTGVPTPLSLFVERDWYSWQFLTDYFKAVGGEEGTIDEKITELMGQGREWEDLAPILLGRVKEAERAMLKPIVATEQPLAGALVRFDGNPILEPVREHPWESKYVFNPAAIRLKGKVYLVYRAVGEDGVSRLGLAVSEDGFKFGQRLAEPIFAPKGSREERGCEDPRLTLIGDRIYMLYTAYDGIIAQIALASITVDDFSNYRWGAWRRHGLVFPGFIDKNAALFPRKFGGKFALLHRVDPHIWITFSPYLRCPWPREEHRILAGATSGMMWDGKKIGTGAPPLKTEFGWLLITHGVDYAHVYRLGVMLLGLTDPTVLLYRSPNPILAPREICEVGEEGKCFVHEVVFTCGVVPADADKKILAAEDQILVYYGAADTTVCVATARVADLIPIGELNSRA